MPVTCGVGAGAHRTTIRTLQAVAARRVTLTHMPLRNAVITEQHMVVIRFRQKGLQGSSQFFNIGRIGVKGRYYFQVKSILSLIVSSLHMFNSRLVAAHGIMRVE